METIRLRQFKVVAELQNLRKASEILHISHSALSKSLKVLQIQLGKELLVQKGRNIQLTEVAYDLLPYIDKILEAEDELISKQKQKVDKIKIVTHEPFSTHLLGNVWQDYFPGKGLELRELLPGYLESSVLEGVSDFGISYEPIANKDLDFIEINSIDMGLFVRNDAFKDMAIKDLPFVAPITPVKSLSAGLKGLDGWPDLTYKRKIKFKVDTLESGLALVRSGQGAIYMPIFLAYFINQSLANTKKLKRIKTPFTTKRNVYLIKRGSYEDRLSLCALQELLLKECSR